MKEEDDENNKKINIPIISDIKEIFDKISSGNLAEIFNLKVFLKKILKNWKLLLLIGIVILVFLTGAYYWKTINVGTEDSESSSNVPNAVSSYTSSLTTGDSGELFDSSTIQDLWDELVGNGSNIEDYLDSAEELMKLVNAELITQNVDTREDPDEEIDWDEVIEEMTYELGDSDEESSDDTEEEEEDEDEDLTSIQGIIKFKRAIANDDGTDYDTETMSYVDYDTFYDWIEIYSEEGDTEVTYNGKKVSVVDCLETHFTLESEETSSSSSTSSDTSEESTEEISTATETYAIVATWNKVVHTETTNDSDREEEAEENSYISYTVSTTKVDYKELTSGYTMPFNYLWEFLVITKDKEFVMALADLVYESEIEITVYDTETINTNTETYNYDIERITITNVEELNYDYTGWISIPSYGRYDIYSGNFSIKKINGEAISKTSEVIDDIRYYYTTETITTTNTLNVELTKANVWMADYEVEISDVSTSENPQNSEAELEDKPIKDETYTSEDFEYGLSNIEEIKEEGSDSAYQIADGRVPDRIKITNDGSIEVDDEEDSSIASIFQNIIANILGTEYNVNVTTTLQEMSGITHIYTETYINRTLETYTNTETTKITLSPMTVTEKTDKNSIEDNFVTLFIAYQGARSSILELWNWLMEIMKANEDTVDLVDLTKYMVFMATGKDYGVTEFDFESLYITSYNLSSVSGLVGDTIEEQVWWALIDAGYSQIATAAAMGNIYVESGFDSTAIEDGTGDGLGLCQWSYGRRTQLEAYISYKGTDTSDVQTQIEFLIGELTPGGGANGYATYQLSGSSSTEYDGTSYTASDWEDATDIETATVAFMALFERPSYDPSKNHLTTRQSKALEYYNTYKDAERPTTDSRIGTISLSNEEDEETMAEMLTLALQIADDDTYTYVYGTPTRNYSSWTKSSIPSSFDCTGFVAWLYYTHFGLTLPSSSDSYSSSDAYTTNMSESNLQPGDVLHRYASESSSNSSGHVGIYLGNGQYVHASSAKSGIKVSTYNSTEFKRVYRYVQ